MNKLAPIIARYLLGLIYFVFGLNGFLHFLGTTPPPMSETATAFFQGLQGSGYFFPVVSGTQVVGGLLLLIGWGAPLGLILLAPVTVHIVLFHYFLTPGLDNQALPLAMLIFHVTAARENWDLYRPLFSMGKKV